MGILSFEKPPFWDHPDAPGSEHVSYRRMWRTNFTVAALVTMLPLIALAALGLFQMNWLDQMERGRQQRTMEMSLARGREYFDDRMREKKAALELAASFLAREQTDLEPLLERLERIIQGFKALAIIDAKGGILAATAKWNARNASPAIFKGQRTVGLIAAESGGEYLILGFPLKHRDGAPWIAAQVGDEDLLRTPEVARPWPQSAAYLVDGNSRVLASSGAEPESSGKGNAVLSATDEIDSPVMAGRLQMNGLPLWLVSRTPLSVLPDHWSSVKAPFIIFMTICLLGMLIMIYRATVNQVTRLYQAHLEQAQVLREIVYTQKLASIGRLASGVGHQINNPVSVINEKAGLLHDLLTYGETSPDPERLTRLVGDIQSMVRRIGSITHRLLGFAKHLPMEVVPVDLGMLAREVTDFLISDNADQNIKVEFDLPPEPVIVESDQSLMEQVLLNVCNNAVGAMDRGGCLTISLADRGGEGVILKVADDGRGIDPEHLKHIFEPYFTTRGELGCGLGLSITYGIVQKLGGEIKVENREKAGAVITVTLPKRTPDALKAGPEEWEGPLPNLQPDPKKAEA